MLWKHTCKIIKNYFCDIFEGIFLSYILYESWDQIEQMTTDVKSDFLWRLIRYHIKACHVWKRLAWHLILAVPEFTESIAVEDFVSDYLLEIDMLQWGENYQDLCTQKKGNWLRFSLLEFSYYFLVRCFCRFVD
jgi:hypothetical protein